MLLGITFKKDSQPKIILSSLLTLMTFQTYIVSFVKHKIRYFEALDPIDVQFYVQIQKAVF